MSPPRFAWLRLLRQRTPWMQHLGRAGQALALVCATQVGGGCAASLRAELSALRAQQRAAEKESQDQALLIQKLASQIERLDRELWSERLCKNTRYAARIADFINQVQAATPEVCTASSLENALIFLRTQPYASAFLDPKEGLEGMHIARGEQLIDLFAEKEVHASTRVLILVQPADETTAAAQAALKMGEQYRDLIRRQIAPKRELRMLGPYLLPCRVRQEILRVFNGPLDRPLATEPKGAAPRIRVWAFKSDC